MSDPREPSESEVDAYADALLRAARLDAAPEATQDRVVRELLAQRERREARLRHGLAGALVVCVGVAAVLAMRVRAERPPPLAPEPARATASAPPVPAPAPGRAPCPSLRVASGVTPLVDDFEDQNARLLLNEHREGHWAVYNDGTGRQKPPALASLHPTRLRAPRGASRFALHTSGDAFTQWGAMFMAEFSTGACYDASAYAGIAFFAKGNTRVHVNLQGIDQISVRYGGLCRDSCPNGPFVPIDLGKEWRRYTVTWAELRALPAQPGFEFDPKRLWAFAVNLFPQDTPFDVWVDDVEFLPR